MLKLVLLDRIHGLKNVLLHQRGRTRFGRQRPCNGPVNIVRPDGLELRISSMASIDRVELRAWWTLIGIVARVV